VYANSISSAACLAVAFLLNTPLALIMLCAVPVAFTILALFNICIRRVKKQSVSELAAAGGLATEVLAGIKTVASLCAQPHFKERYENHVNASAKFSIRATVLSSLLAGITGALFYFTYTIAFVVGTEQVISGMAMPVIIKCFELQGHWCIGYVLHIRCHSLRHLLWIGKKGSFAFNALFGHSQLIDFLACRWDLACP
jgi:ATP-binding cassette subfamily B (MDR/TAP) protein 1